MAKPFSNLRDKMSPKTKAFADKFYAEHREAMESLARGIADAKAGRFAEPPDLEADAKLIEQMYDTATPE